MPIPFLCFSFFSLQIIDKVPDDEDIVVGEVDESVLLDITVSVSSPPSCHEKA